MSTTIEEGVVIIPPFGIEASTPNNGDLRVQSIPGLRLRGRLDATKTLKDRNGEDFLPESRSKLAMLGVVPGMELHLNPEHLTYKVRDPLHGDEELQDRLEGRLRQVMGRRNVSTPRGVPPTSGTIDVDRMKSLVRELYNNEKAGSLNVIRGDIPSMRDIEGMPGRFLLNPGSVTDWTQPRYEDELDAWRQQLSRIGA